MTVKLQKWGNSLGVRIPKAVAQHAGLSEGSQVEVRVEGDSVVLDPVTVPSLKDLLAQVKRGSRPELAEWGAPVGNEVW